MLANIFSYLGDSISGTCRKLLLFCLGVGESSVGAGRESSSATGTCGEPNPVWMPYSISWNTLENKVLRYTILSLDINTYDYKYEMKTT